MTIQRLRVVSDNDYSGDPDGLVQLAHQLLSPSTDLRVVIGSRLRAGDGFDPSQSTADNAAARARDVIAALSTAHHGQTPLVIAGSNDALKDEATPIESAAAKAIVAEAMRDDTGLPLYVTCGAGLTEIASAWLMEPRIAERLTLVWIGGAEDPVLAIPPPHSSSVEYNLAIAVTAARVVFNRSNLPIWQVPRNAYRQALVSMAEIEERIRPHGAIGRMLHGAIDAVRASAGSAGDSLGETYILGDSPLVLLTALQSSFQPDPSSSSFVMRPAPFIRGDGTPDFRPTGRPIRVYTQLDVRLMLDDLFVKLRRLEQ